MALVSDWHAMRGRTYCAAIVVCRGGVAATSTGFDSAVSAAAPTPVRYSRRPGLAFYLVVLYSFNVLFLWAKQIWRLFLWRKRIRECCAITHGRVFDLFTEAKRLADCRFSATLRDGGALLPIPASLGCGQWRTVLCPLREQENFSDAELKMLMIHELTHLKHSDNPVAFILCMVSSLCWLNPFILLFVKRAVMGFELDCDNAVRRTMNLSGSAAASYAKLLLPYQLQGNNKALRPVLTSGLSTTAKELKLRIQELKLFFSPENQAGDVHITITQVGLNVYFLPHPDSNIPTADTGVPQLLQDAFMQAVA